MAQKTPEQLRKRRHLRIRNSITGTADRPRLVVHRSNKGVHAQVVDDRAGRTLAAADWQEPEIRALARKERAGRVGELVAQRAKDAGVTTVVFDRGGYLYHGRVRELAEKARAGGLQF